MMRLENNTSTRYARSVCAGWVFLFFTLRPTDLYFCTAADSKYFHNLLNLIGSIHKTNFDNLKEIAVYNLGLTQEEQNTLKTIQKTNIYEVELTHSDLLKQFKTTPQGKEVPGWYAWKPVIIKQSLQKFPYVLYIDSGLAVLRPLDILFKYIIQHKYFLGRLRPHSVWAQTNRYLTEKFELNKPENEWVIYQDPIVGFIIGASQDAQDIFVNQFYDYTRDIKNFEDDGTCPGGFGNYRHDQSLLSIYGNLKRLTTHPLGCIDNIPILLEVNGEQQEFYFHVDLPCVNIRTHIYYSARFDHRHNKYAEFIRYKVKN